MLCVKMGSETRKGAKDSVLIKLQHLIQPDLKPTCPWTSLQLSQPSVFNLFRLGWAS